MHLPLLILAAAVLVALLGLALGALIAHWADDDWSAYDDAALPVICCDCGAHLRGPAASTPGSPISHGLCVTCATRHLQAIEAQSPQPAHSSSSSSPSVPSM